MATRVKSRITMEGPFFQTDPRLKFRQNVRLFTAAFAAEGEEDVRRQLQAGEGDRRPVRAARPNRVSAHVVGRTESLKGRDWAMTAVVSINNRRQSAAGGLQLMAAASLLEGRYGAMRKTFYRMRRVRKMHVAELLKGLE